MEITTVTMVSLLSSTTVFISTVNLYFLKWIVSAVNLYFLDWFNQIFKCFLTILELKECQSLSLQS